MGKTAIIIGAGPAGLTAAYELLKYTDIKPVIIEKSNYIGGISRTVVHNGNRIDIGGHRFFSKSNIVMDWWQDILPIQGADPKDGILKNVHNNKKIPLSKLSPNGPDPEKTDRVMLLRNRISHIYFLRKFFDYPITINSNTIANLGPSRILKIGWSYLLVQLFPVKKIETLEDFFISRFGKELYKTFFKDYTKKVWGVPCSEIAADWGAQRIKGLSVSKAVWHALKTMLRRENPVGQKNTDTSLIEQFLYPKLGPGQMWETVASMVEEKGGTIIRNSEVTKIGVFGEKITGITYFDRCAETEVVLYGDYFFSSMAVKDLIRAFGNEVPPEVKSVSKGLQYRDFITVGLLLNKLEIENKTRFFTLNNMVPDNWIYIQESDVKVGRLQIFNNWSPYLVADIEKVWIGLEYFCNEGDELWKMADDEFIRFAINELCKINIINENEVLDSVIIREPKTYPAYFGTYHDFGKIRQYTDQFENLFLIGRNGMHKYNNQDHSMLTAIAAVKNIISGSKSKENIWGINNDKEYHEEK